MITSRERFVNYFILILFSLIVLLPMAWMVLTALSPTAGGLIDLSNLSWGNFSEAWTQGGFGRAMASSLLITAFVVAIGLVLAILSGYAFGVLGVIGGKILFPLILAGIMIPTEAIVVPLYYDFRDYGLAGTYQGLILIHLGIGVSFGAFWMRTTFRAIPKPLIESAKLDGANSWRVLWRIAVPISKPAIITFIVLSFMWTWNDYFLALVFLSDPDKAPVTLALGNFQSKYSSEINLMAAGAVLICAPIVILYIFFQRQFIQGVLTGAIRE